VRFIRRSNSLRITSAFARLFTTLETSETPVRDQQHRPHGGVPGSVDPGNA